MNSGNEPVPVTLVERLTQQFYDWEKRGRGWQVWDYPVVLEPPFLPFFHYAPPKPIVDDGRTPGLWERFKRAFSNPQKSQAYSTVEEELFPVGDAAPFSEDENLAEIRVVLPPEAKIHKEAAEQFLLNLSYCSYPLCFEVIGLSDTIVFQITCREGDKQAMRQQLQAYFPEAQLFEQTGFLERHWDQEEPSVIADFGLSKEFMLPLKVCRSFDNDPLTGICGALSNLQESEIGLLQVLFQRSAYPWEESIVRSVTDWEGQSFFVDAPEMVSLAKEKASRPLFAAVIRVAAQSQSEEKAWTTVRNLGGALSQFSYPAGNELIPLSNDNYDRLDHAQSVLCRRSHRSGMLLNSEELVSLVHLPSAGVRIAKIRPKVKELERTRAAPRIAEGHDLILGENLHNEKKTLVSLSPDQRMKHTYIIGTSGTGKSTLFLNLIVQDIKQGKGLAVLDPHGDLIEQILGQIPEERFEDVVLFDPADEEYAVGFNVLSAHTETEKNLLASDLVSLFRRLATTWGDQMTAVLGNAVTAFLDSKEGGSLIDLRHFLVEKEYRERFLKTVQDPEIVYYWQKEFPLLSGKPQASLLTRLDAFLRPKLIRHIVSQKESRLNMGKIMNEGKIFLAKLSQGAIGEENAFLLGTLLVSKFHQLALSRQEIEESQRKDFYLYIDEFHNFITPSMASILSGARKFRLGLILAHQELRQLWERDKEVASAVIANPYTRICFRLGDFDAKKLQEGFSFFEAQDLQNLGTGEAICRVERAEYDFNLKTNPLPPIDKETAEKKKGIIRALSREKYGIKRSFIEEELQKKLAWVPLPVEETKTLPKREISWPSGVEKREAHSMTRFPIDSEVIKTEPPAVSRAEPAKEILKPSIPEPILLGRGGPQHKRLQYFIKRMAEDKGYKATIEKQVEKGGIDVVLEKEGNPAIACEVSVTTSPDQEIGNLEKCLAAGYEQILLVSEERKTLNKTRELAARKFKEEELSRLQFVTPDELLYFLNALGAKEAGQEAVTLGYKVKTTFNPLTREKEEMHRKSIVKTAFGVIGESDCKK